MSARPTSITVIGWILIVFGIFGLIGVLGLMGTSNNPLMQQALALIPVPFWVQMTVGVVGTVLRIASGVGLLYRQNWARYLYALYGLAGFCYGFYVSPYRLLMISGLAVYILVLVFLFLPNANAWFKGEEAAPAG